MANDVNLRIVTSPTTVVVVDIGSYPKYIYIYIYILYIIYIAFSGILCDSSTAILPRRTGGTLEI